MRRAVLFALLLASSPICISGQQEQALSDVSAAALVTADSTHNEEHHQVPEGHPEDMPFVEEDYYYADAVPWGEEDQADPERNSLGNLNRLLERLPVPFALQHLNHPEQMAAFASRQDYDTYGDQEGAMSSAEYEWLPEPQAHAGVFDLVSNALMTPDGDHGKDDEERLFGQSLTFGGDGEARSALFDQLTRCVPRFQPLRSWPGWRARRRPTSPSPTRSSRPSQPSATPPSS